MQAQYKGEVEIIERDDDAHVAVLKADGRESRGQGNASATITARLTPDGDGTAVSILTELTITGRVAQFGRGVLADVSAGLLDQFVERLESTVLAEDVGGSTATDPPSRGEPSSDDSEGDAADPAVEAGPNQPEPKGEGGPTSAVRRIDSPEAEPVDLMAAAGSPVAKRAVPLAIAAAAIAVLLLILRSRRRGGGAGARHEGGAHDD